VLNKLWRAATAAGALVAMSVAMCMPASADEKWIDEVRVGLYDHNSNLISSRDETSNPDINVEVLFPSPDWLSWAFAPRPQLGANINTGNGTSIAYAGLAWDYTIVGGLFIEGSFGGAVHNGRTDRETSNKLDLGCRAMFHENASVGWHFDDHSSLMATIDHMSNASLCDNNPGLTDFGVRYGYSF